MPAKSKDRVVRAMTQDGQFRVIAASTGATCMEAQSHQDAPENLAGAQVELICAGVLLRETMQPGNRVQIILRTSEGDRLVTDSLPDGKNRSIVNPGSEGGAGQSGMVQVAYTLRNGELHNGIVAVGDSVDVSEVLMRYLQESEQITAFVSISQGSGEGMRVGGFVVQVTPEVTHEGLAAMTEHLESYDGLGDWLDSEQMDPEALIAELLVGQDYELLADSELSFGCTCSHERMILGLSTLPKGDIADLLQEDEGIEVSCDACGRQYQISGDELAGMLADGSQEPGPPN